MDTSVLIVGAGPVGLALANELGWRGVPFLLVDEGQGDIVFPAGEGIFSRTMEHLRRWGVAAQVRHDPGFPDDYVLNVGFATSLHGRMVACFEGTSNARMPEQCAAFSPEGPMICPKFVFDTALRRRAAEQPAGELRYGTRLVGFTDTGDGVRATLENVQDGRRYEVRARYLAAADGARSMVRKQLGIPFVGTFGEGRNFAVHFEAPTLQQQLRAHFGTTLFQLHTINTPHRPYFTTVDGGSQWRMSMYIEGDDPHAETALRDILGEGVPFRVLRAQPWSGHRVVAREYRSGSVFLLGDAAHLRWPKGGFGANTGIGDAVDLGWKIAAVLAGWGGPRLLDSYGNERRPIAIRNVNEASNNRVFDRGVASDPLLDEDSADGAAARTRLSQLLFATRLREFRTHGVQLGHRYRQSGIVVPDEVGLEPADDHWLYQPTTWPGGRAPHLWLAPGDSILDHFGRGFTLVCTGHAQEPAALVAAAAAQRIPMQVLHVPGEAARTLYETPLVLVRPDGHVAWRGDAVDVVDPAALWRHVVGA